MDPFRYIDIHTHREQSAPELLSLVNKYGRFDAVAAGRYYSMGLHPWYLEDVPAQMANLEQYAAGPKVLAIGECGLDKVCKTDWALQETAFRLQIGLANTLHKPLTVHCVRAYTETVKLLRAAKLPAIFHGFNRKASLAEDLLQEGHYLSFGAALLQSPALADVLRLVPAGRFFLETDDADISIREIYTAAAAIRKTGEDVIILQLQQNFKDVFGI